MLKYSCLGHTVSTRIVTNIKKNCLLFRCNKLKNLNEPFNDFYHIKVSKLFRLYLILFLVFNFFNRFKTCGFKIGIAHSITITNPLLMNPNPIPTQIYTIPTPNPIPRHMIPNPESNPDSDSSFDSDSAFGIAPGLATCMLRST